MSTRIQLVIDCADPDRLTRFWAEALGYQVPPPPEGFDTSGGRTVPIDTRKERVEFCIH